MVFGFFVLAGSVLVHRTVCTLSSPSFPRGIVALGVLMVDEWIDPVLPTYMGELVGLVYPLPSVSPLEGLSEDRVVALVFRPNPMSWSRAAHMDLMISRMRCMLRTVGWLKLFQVPK